MMDMHFVSKSCGGHRCRCGNPATHKVGEEIPWDDPAHAREAAKRGLILLSCGVYANVIRVLVPLTASDALLDEGLGLLAAALDATA